MRSLRNSPSVALNSYGCFSSSLIQLNFLVTKRSTVHHITKFYSEACLKLCKEIGVTAIDLWTAMQQREDWLNSCFTDGIHLSAEGRKIVVKEIIKVLKNADWEPSLYWMSMPSEFLGVAPIDSEASERYIARKEQWERDLIADH